MRKRGPLVYKTKIKQPKSKTVTKPRKTKQKKKKKKKKKRRKNEESPHNRPTIHPFMHACM